MNIHTKLKEENSNILKHISIQMNLINMYGKNGVVYSMRENIFDDIKRNEGNKY